MHRSKYILCLFFPLLTHVPILYAVNLSPSASFALASVGQLFDLNPLNTRSLNGPSQTSQHLLSSSEAGAASAASPLPSFATLLDDAAACSLSSSTRTQLAPKKAVNIKRHKGRIPIPIGGSTRGTTLAFGEWGIRLKGNGVRFSASQLLAAEEVLKRELKTIKGAKVFLRVFTDIPVCIKGSEMRMGKGKGSFEFWATRVPTGRVIFEIGGPPIREELAREALRQAASKLPAVYEFIHASAPPRLGRLLMTPSPLTLCEGSRTQSVSAPT